MIIVVMGDESFRLRKSLETASKMGARFALIVGENEPPVTWPLALIPSGSVCVPPPPSEPRSVIV